MTAPALHIFAVNTDLDTRHTYLSRAAGDAPKLPNLAGWLGLRQGGLDTDEIELFPIKDLADMPLSGYLATAFDILDKPLGQTAARLNALDGHVLLIPSAAIAGDIKTGAELTEIATLPMAQADHSAGALQPTPPQDPEPEPENIGWHSKRSKRNPASYVVIALCIAAVVVFLRDMW